MGALLDDGALVLRVSDRGTGLEPGEEKKVFEKFYRGTGARPGGTGLGLSIVQGIARRTSRRSDCGQRFKRRRNVYDSPARRDNGETSMSPERIVLVVDDEPPIRRLLRLTLEPQGYRVFEADAGQLGLQEAAARRPDVVILDLGLPDMDGIATLKSLREWSQVAGLGAHRARPRIRQSRGAGCRRG